MTLTQVKTAVENDCILWDIGQINEESKKWLTKEIKKGRVEKIYGLWPYFTYGLCRKFYYRKKYEIKDGMAWDKK